MRASGVKTLNHELPTLTCSNRAGSTLAWRIPWTEEPGGLQAMGSQSPSDSTHTHTHTHTHTSHNVKVNEGHHSPLGQHTAGSAHLRISMPSFLSMPSGGAHSAIEDICALHSSLLSLLRKFEGRGDY